MHPDPMRCVAEIGTQLGRTEMTTLHTDNKKKPQLLPVRGCESLFVSLTRVSVSLSLMHRGVMLN